MNSILSLIDPFYEPILDRWEDEKNEISSPEYLNLLEPFRNIIIDWEEWRASATTKQIQQISQLYSISNGHDQDMKCIVFQEQQKYILNQGIHRDLLDPFTQDPISSIPVIFIATYEYNYFSILDLYPFVIMAWQQGRIPKNPFTNQPFSLDFLNALCDRIAYLHECLQV